MAKIMWLRWLRFRIWWNDEDGQEAIDAVTKAFMLRISRRLTQDGDSDVKSVWPDAEAA